VPLSKLVKRQRVHFSRNPLLMRVLRAFGFVRERGEGIPRMFEIMEASALPPPDLQDDGLTFTVTLRNTSLFDEETMRWLRQFPLERLNARQRRILAWCYQGQGSFAVRDYARVNEVDISVAQREIQQMVNQGIVERVGERKAARYYPVAQAGDLLDKLRDFFKRHDSLSNAEFRQLAAISNYKKASALLRRLTEEGFLRAKGEKRWTRYYPTGQLIQKRI
jgi:ATP-dependent DNA helicase RecG